MRDLEERIKALVEETADEIAGIIAGSHGVTPGEIVELIELPLKELGGVGSGHFGHEGRPGEVGGSKPSGAVADIGSGSIDERLERLKSLGANVASRSVDEFLEVGADAFEDGTGWGATYSREGYYENWRKRYNNFDAVASEDFQEWVLSGLELAISQGMVDPDGLYIIIRRADPDDPGEQNSAKAMGNVVLVLQTEYDEDVEFSKRYSEENRISPSEWGNRDLSDYTFAAGSAFDDRYSGVIAHEMGHINSRRGEETGSYRRAQLLLSDQDRRNEIRKWISDYALESAGEFEAEAYALSRHPRLNEFPEETQRIVNHIINGEDL